MILFLDNNDSFSCNILKKIYLKNFICNFFNLKIKKFFLSFKEKIFIFGPGPSNNINSNLNTIIIDKYINKKKFLGICLGHQILCCYFGYNIFKLNKFNHGQLKNFFFYIKKYKIFVKKKIIFYNSLSCYGIKRLFNLSKKNTELFISFNSLLKIKSFQFHPESIISNNNIFL